LYSQNVMLSYKVNCYVRTGGEYSSTKDAIIATNDNKGYVCCVPKADCSNVAFACLGTTTKKENRCSADVSKCTQAHCCKDDIRSCKNSGSTTCKLADHYKDSTKDNNVWLGSASNDPTEECCTAVATCGTAGCNTQKKGLKLVAAQNAVKCTGGAASCPATCCEKDNTKCGVNNEHHTCTAATHYKRPDTESTLGVFVPDLAKSDGNCCLPRADCNAYSCQTKKKGLKVVAAKATDKCTTNAASCVEATCCELDANTCGANGVNQACPATHVFKPGSEDVSPKSVAACCMPKLSCLALKASITCITGWTEYDSTKDTTVVTETAKNTKCCKAVTAWNKCPAPETKTPGTSGSTGGGSGSGAGGTVGSPSGLDKLKPLACWRVALFVAMMASFRS